MGQINLSGVLSAGPPLGSEQFPASSFSVPISFRNSAMSFAVGTGVLTQNIAAADFVALVGVGPTAPVTQGSFLYLKSDGPVTLRLTQDNGAGGTVVQTIAVQGLVLLEFSSTQPLELLEVKGNAKIEYFVAGQS